MLRVAEDALEPELPIIDAHHHLWDKLQPWEGDSFNTLIPTRYLLEELAGDTDTCGHNVIATVFVQCNAMYRKDGPEVMRPLGEAEFVQGVAAMSAVRHSTPAPTSTHPFS